MGTRRRKENEIASILLKTSGVNSAEEDDQSDSSESDDLSIQYDLESEEDAEGVLEPNLNLDYEKNPQFVHGKSDYGADNDSGETTPTTSMKKRKKEAHYNLYGENNYEWNNEMSETRGKRSSSKVTILPRPAIGPATEIKTPLEAWSLLFTENILEEVVKFTNEQMAKKRGGKDPPEIYHGDTSIVELKAFIGLLYASGLLKINDTNPEDLWSVSFGVDLFRTTMTLDRFKFINQNLRFDDKETRSERKKIDKFSPIRDVWEMFISNCKRHYHPHQYVTIDQQLLSFQGRCGFRVHMKRKPDKYGLKILMMNDARTFYMINAIPYVGKPRTEDSEEFHHVRKLSEPIHGTNRTITCGNWFTSVDLIEKMIDQFSLSMVGAIRKDRKEIPASFKTSQMVGSSRFIYDKNKTMVCFAPKKDKIVLALSSLHHIGKIDHTSGKPEIILHYDSTKGGSETFHQLCREYTTSRVTHRWAIRLWYGMLDQGGVNGMILYLFNANNEVLNRRGFLKELSLSLIDPFRRKERVSAVRSFRRNPNFNEEEICKSKLSPELKSGENILNKKVRCAICPREQDRKTRIFCTSCRYPMCNIHRLSICIRCLKDEV